MDEPLYAMAFWGPMQGTIVGFGGMILSTTPVTTGIGNSDRTQHAMPTQHALLQNYPNPFNPKTAISYKLLANSFVNIRLFDVLGREVAVLVNEIRAAGTHTVHWNASPLPSGVYYCRLSVTDAVQTITQRFEASTKMLLLK